VTSALEKVLDELRVTLLDWERSRVWGDLTVEVRGGVPCLLKKQVQKRLAHQPKENIGGLTP
jgi:hypothetical protein